MANDPELYFADDGTPRSGRFGDVYYSLQDGLAESQAVFLAGCRLPEAWTGRQRFTVLELGFGTGLNIAALMQMWERTRPSGAHLHILSIEGFLMAPEEARRALSAWPELDRYAEAIVAQWPRPRDGFVYMDFPQWDVSVTLALMDVRQALAAWQGPADAVFLDGFSPALNPDMWGEDVMRLVAERTRAGAHLATFTVAGFVRRGLQAAGFTVEKRPGHGRKRERLEAVRTGEASDAAAPPRRIAIIGAGIAGCSLAWQARLLGFDADIYDTQEPGAGASGNPAALVTPRLDAGGGPISALFADAFAYAGAFYRRVCPDAILGEGVLHAATDARDSRRHTKIVDQTVFASGDLGLFGPGEAPDLPHTGGIRLNSALYIRPRDVLHALVREPVRTQRIMALPEGYDALILACGDGIFDFSCASHLALRSVRGQLEVADCVKPLQNAISWGGYAIPLDGGLLFGATHDRDDRATDVRDGDRRRNIETLARMLPRHAAALGDAQSRASVRVASRDHLPVAGQVAPGVHILTGLGGRGFCLAPLLAKAVLHGLCGLPSPLTRFVEALVSPARMATE